MERNRKADPGIYVAGVYSRIAYRLKGAIRRNACVWVLCSQEAGRLRDPFDAAAMDHPVIKILKILVQVVWTVLVIGLFTLIGAVNGYESTGTLGAIVVGIIGFFFGAVLAAFPTLALQLFGR